MARTWTLGGTTLPNPQGFSRRPIENVATHTTSTGKTVRQINNRKFEYVLSYEFLTQTERDSIYSLLNQDEALSFTVTDGSLTIASTTVHMVINDERFNAKGSEFREDLDVILTEVI